MNRNSWIDQLKKYLNRYELAHLSWYDLEYLNWFELDYLNGYELNSRITMN